MKTLLTSLTLAAAGLVCAADSPKFALSEDFEKGFDRWEPGAPQNWRLADDHGGKVFDLFDKALRIKTPHRSPFNFALLKDEKLGEVTVTVKAKSTVKSYGHRDIVIVFGYQDPGHFYYVHFGEKADDHSCQVFIVNGADRKKISTKETTGIPWKDDTWHTARVSRAADGSIKVWFDDMSTTVLEAKDTTFGAGRVGIGSFDDTARFDDVVVEGARGS